jgi:hypothetical protein
MKVKKYITLSLVLLISISFSGCIGVNRNFKQVRQHLMSELDVEYDKQFEFSIGSAGLALAGMIVKLSDVEEPIEEVLANVSRVQIGVYEREHAYGQFNAEFSDLKKLTDILEKDGWKYIVRSVQDDEMAAVFVNADDEDFNRIYVIAANDDEMVLVEVHGDLSKVIEVALREKGLRFHMAEN